MAKLNNVIFGNQTQIDQIFSGTPVSGHSYSNQDLYVEELADEIELGAIGSGTKINSNNQLITDVPPCTQTTNGTYILKATISNEVVTYSWVAE